MNDFASGVFKLITTPSGLGAVPAAPSRASGDDNMSLGRRDRSLTEKGAEYEFQTLAKKEERFRKEWKKQIATLQDARSSAGEANEVSRVQLDQLHGHLKSAKEFGDHVRDITEQARSCTVDQATKDATISFIIQAHGSLTSQLEALAHWVQGLQVVAPEEAASETRPENTQKPPSSRAGSKRSGSNRTSISNASSTTRKRLEAQAQLRLVLEQKKRQAEREALEREQQERRVALEREEQERRATLEREEQERRAALQQEERERAERRAALEQEERVRKEREALDDAELKAKIDLELANELELAANADQYLGDDDPDRIGQRDPGLAAPSSLRFLAPPFVPTDRDPHLPTTVKSSKGPSPVVPQPNGARQPITLTAFENYNPRVQCEDELRVPEPQPKYEPPTPMSDSATAATLAEIMLVGPPEIEKFKGDSREWIPFVTQFESTIASKTMNEALKMTKLWKNLDESVRPFVTNCRLDLENGYSQAMRELWKHFGHPVKIADAVLEHLLEDTKPIIASDHVGMMTLTSAIGSSLQTIEAVQKRFVDNTGYDYTAVLDTRDTLLKLLKRLPSYLQRDFVNSLGGHPGDLRRLHRFLQERTRANAHPLFQALAKDNQRSNTTRKPSTPSAPQTNRSNKNVYATSTDEPEPKRQTLGGEARKKDCPVCEKLHSLANCDKYREMNGSDRWKVAKKVGCCYACLEHSHMIKDCKSAVKCTDNDCIVRMKHHPLLHQRKRKEPEQEVENKLKPGQEVENSERTAPDFDQTTTAAKPQVNHAKFTKLRADAFLGIIPVRIQNPETGKSYTTFAMLDPCANVDVATPELIDVLGLGVQECDEVATVHTVMGETVAQVRLTDVFVKGIGGQEHEKLLDQAMVLNANQFEMNRVPNRRDLERWDHLGLVTPVDVVDIPRVLLLISAQHPDLQRPLSVIQLTSNEDGPYIIETKLGFALYGGEVQSPRCQVHHTRLMVTNKQVENMLSPEDLSGVYDTRKAPSVNEMVAEERMVNGMKCEEGRYTVPIPFVEEDVRMPDNLEQAVKCLEGMRKRFRKNPRYFEEYSHAIGQYILDGHAEEIKPEEIQTPEGKRNYLIHHGVRHPRKKKVRVVFNLSKRFKKKSLNDAIIECPDMLERLIGVLMRFRLKPTAVTADIKKFFHAILVPSGQADMMRFVWFRDNDVEGEIVHYRMKVQVFGGIASQAAAVVALRDVITKQLQNGWTLEEITAILQSFYSDDYVSSFDEPEEARELVSRITEALKNNGFTLRGFVSNEEAVADWLNGMDKGEDEEETSVLGIRWNKKNDELSFQFCPKEPKGFRYTKRECLSQLMGLFDPLGLLLPFALELKVLVHELVIEGFLWDEEIPEEYHKKVTKCLANMSAVSELKIPRCCHKKKNEVATTELHVFSDGSGTAYGCSAYLRTEETTGKVSVELIYAKNRLCPASVKLTIPRIELCAATLAVRLVEDVRRELGIKLDRVQYWTDSVAVLRYIRNKTKRFHTFVANRVSEIRHQTNPDLDWRYVNTDANPADCCSREMKVSETSRAKLWFGGPPFLRLPHAEWPTGEIDVNEDEDDEDPEVRRSRPAVHHHRLNDCPPSERDVLLKLQKMIVRAPSSYAAKKRIYWLRAFINWKVRNRGIGQVGPPQCRDLEAAQIDIARIAQCIAFPEEFAFCKKGRQLTKKSATYKLSPVFDHEKQVMRVQTRLQRTNVPIDFKLPIIVPKNSHLAGVLVREAHEAVGHQGVEAVFAEIRKRWWIIGSKSTIKAILNRCVPCKRYHYRTAEQVMAQLPEERVDLGCPVFSSTAVDLFGPFYVKRARSLIKRYGALYTCLTTRAVHIEVVADLSADSFIQSFRRFTARRGRISVLRSDQGTNLRGANRELAEALEEWNRSGLGDRFQQIGIDWRFNTAGASHHGGAHERLIRSARECLCHVLDQQTINDEGLNTLMCEVEAILNSRPLQPNNDDPDSLVALCPNDILLMRPTSGLPPGLFPTEGILRRKWRQCQAMADAFWKKFREEYLHTLSLRSKWIRKRRNVSVGDLVLLKEPNQPRSQWPLGRITLVRLSEDGLVRTCRVRTSSGEYERPIVKVCVLEGCNN